MSETGGSLLGHAEEVNEGALQALFFVVIALFLGVFTKQALAWTKLPFTALLLVWGVLLGIGNETYIQHWHYVGPGLTVWEDIEPNFFLALLLPLIIYSAAINMHWHTLRRCMFQVLLLAGPGVVIGTALTAVFVKYAFPYHWTWLESLLFGAMLSATDPVAVIALLQEVGAEKELRTVIEGESLFNDGSAYVLFLLFHNALEGEALTARSVVSQLSQLSLGGPAVGVAFGLVVVVWLKFIYNQDVVEVTMTIVAALGSFIVANEILGVSGVLAVLCLGILMAAFGSHHISRQVQQPLHIIWEELEFIANTLIFILAGVIIAGNIYQSEHNNGTTLQIRARDYGYAFLLWVVLLAIRAIIFAVCFPLLKCTGYSITFRKAVVMVWAGLRGAVGLVLSLFVLFDGQIADRSFRLLAFFFVGLIAAITILVQGTTTGYLLQALGLTRRLSAKRTFLNNVMKEVERYGDTHAQMVNNSDILGPPNWKDISSLASLNAKQLLTRYASAHSIKRPFPYWDPASDVELEASHRHVTAERKTTQFRQETRARLLRAVQQTYEDVFERAQIAPAHMYKLKKSSNMALDHTDEALHDCEYLSQKAQLPSWLHWLQRLRGLPFMAAFCRQQLFSHLEHNASLMVAFHYSHTDAAQSMLHFDSLIQEEMQQQDSTGDAPAGAGISGYDAADAAKANIIQEVIVESKNQLKVAEQYLFAMRMAYPEVLASIRTKQVAQEILLVKEAYVHELKASGLMDGAEVEEVVHLVERKKKQLHFAGSLIHVLPASDELRQMLLFQGLSDADFAKVASAAKLHLIPAGAAVHPHPAAKSTVLFVLRGALSLQTATADQAKPEPMPHTDSQTSQLAQSSDAAVQPGSTQPSALSLVNSVSPHSSSSQQSDAVDRHSEQAGNHEQVSQRILESNPKQLPGNGENAAAKDVLDARGCAFRIPGFLHETPLNVTATAKTVVEAFELPWALLQSLAVPQQAMGIRLLQLHAAHAAMLSGGALLATASWTQLQEIFRKAKLEEILPGDKVHLTTPGFVLSGQLQLVAAPAEATHESSEAACATSGEDKPSSGRVLHGPDSYDTSGLDGLCLQHAQVFHLPAELLGAVRKQQQQQQSLTTVSADVQPDGSDCRPGSDQQIEGRVGEPVTATATDTGHWGKKLHEPSPFLSHDLWGKLG